MIWNAPVPTGFSCSQKNVGHTNYQLQSCYAENVHVKKCWNPLHKVSPQRGGQLSPPMSACGVEDAHPGGQFRWSHQHLHQILPVYHHIIVSVTKNQVLFYARTELLNGYAGLCPNLATWKWSKNRIIKIFQLLAQNRKDDDLLDPLVTTWSLGLWWRSRLYSCCGTTTKTYVLLHLQQQQ